MWLFSLCVEKRLHSFWAYAALYVFPSSHSCDSGQLTSCLMSLLVSSDCVCSVQSGPCVCPVSVWLSVFQRTKPWEMAMAGIKKWKLLWCLIHLCLSWFMESCSSSWPLRVSPASCFLLKPARNKTEEESKNGDGTAWWGYVFTRLPKQPFS